MSECDECDDTRIGGHGGHCRGCRDKHGRPMSDEQSTCPRCGCPGPECGGPEKAMCDYAASLLRERDEEIKAKRLVVQEMNEDLIRLRRERDEARAELADVTESARLLHREAMAMRRVVEAAEAWENCSCERCRTADHWDECERAVTLVDAVDEYRKEQQDG